MLKLPVRVLPFKGEVPQDQEEELLVPVHFARIEAGVPITRKAMLKASNFCYDLLELRKKEGDGIVFEGCGNNSVYDALKFYAKKYGKKIRTR